MRTGMSWLRAALATACLVGAPASGRADIPDNRVRIGVLTDMNGPNADSTGRGSVVAARLAVEDARALLPGVAIEVIDADHQNKADLASTIARDWVTNRGVNAIADVPFSSAGLAVNEVVRDAPRTAFIPSGSGTSDLTGAKCSPNTVHWTYDTYAPGNVIARALTGLGAKSWYFVTADYAFGHALERDTTGVIRALGGTVAGGVRHPAFAPDFSSFLLQAQSSSADVIAFANASGDTSNSIKQANEFGMIGGRQRIAALLMLIVDVEAIGLATAKGLYVASPFYWDLNDGTRAFADRFSAAMNGRRPTMLQAGVYAGVLHYLKAVAAQKTTVQPQVVDAMKAMPTDDPLFGRGSIRKDGRKIHDYYLFQIKSPQESKGAWDDYKLVATVPASEAFRSMGEGGCPLAQ